jgi:hypothetical protein
MPGEEILVIGSVAVMVVGPGATAVARPFEPGVLLIVATPVADELQTHEDVSPGGVIEPSSNVP